MTATTIGLCESLVRHCPDLSALLAGHKNDYDELLPNVFLGDVTRYVLADGKERRQIVAFLNQSLSSGDPDVENLVAVSFVENLESREQLDRAVDGVDAPLIVAEWKRQRSVQGLA